MTQVSSWTIQAYRQALTSGRLDPAQRYEIIDGELLPMSPPLFLHQWVAKILFRLLDRFVLNQDLGEVFFAPLDVVLSDIQKPQPDLLFVAKDRLNIIHRFGTIEGAPDLIIEILSSSTAKADQNRKRQIYETAGVKEYWLIDTDKQTATVLSLQANLFVEIEQTTNRLSSAVVLKGFEVALSDLFDLPLGITED